MTAVVGVSASACINLVSRKLQGALITVEMRIIK